MRARLEAVHFGTAGGPFPRLARVLELTARRHCPGWDVNVRRVDPHGLRAASGSDSEAANHYKLRLWRDVAASAPRGARILLIDADTFVTAPLDPLWDADFDVAYTARPAGSRYPFNAGVIALRAGDAVRRFLDAWLAQDAHFLRDNAELRPWRRRFGGQNQASLGALLEGGVAAALGVQVAALPCAEWNCEDTTWARFGPWTRIVHVKGALRMHALGTADFDHTRELATLWRGLEAETMRAAEALA